MRGEIERFSSGWSQINLRLRKHEIEAIIAALRRLSVDSHFHLRATFDDSSSTNGIADIEVSMQGDEEVDNLTLE